MKNIAGEMLKRHNLWNRNQTLYNVLTGLAMAFVSTTNKQQQQQINDVACYVISSI